MELLFGDVFIHFLNICKYSSISPRIILLEGLSGSGKSTIINEIGNNLDKTINNISGLLHLSSDINYINNIGLYDNIEYWIGSSEESNRDEVQTARLLFLFNLLDNPPFNILIVTCITKSVLPSLLLSKFTDILSIDFPSIKQREYIIQHYLSLYYPIVLNKSSKEYQYCSTIAQNTFGFLPCDIKRLCNEIILQIKLHDNNWETINLSYYNNPKSIIHLSSIPIYTIDPIPKIKWTDIGGLESIKNELQEYIIWMYNYKESFYRMGIDPIKGILLHGPPGTGKTLLAKAIATEVKANFINIKISKLINAYFGESEKILSNIFDRAKKVAPSVIFFDEIEAFFGERDDESTNSDTLISQFLLELDNISINKPVIILGATNCIERIDENFKQNGRFDKLLYIGPPDYWERKHILELYINKIKTSTSININTIAEKTESFTGADLYNLCNIAGQIAITEDINITEITQNHFDLALKQITKKL